MNDNIKRFDNLIEKLGPITTVISTKILMLIDRDNSIDLSLLGLEKQNLKIIRAKLIRVGFIKRLKINSDVKMRYYVNPIYGTKTRKMSEQLYNSFNEINEGSIY